MNAIQDKDSDFDRITQKRIKLFIELTIYDLAENLITKEKLYYSYLEEIKRVKAFKILGNDGIFTVEKLISLTMNMLGSKAELSKEVKTLIKAYIDFLLTIERD